MFRSELMKKCEKSLYKIADPFMAFYYKFVVPNRSFIELGRRLPIEQALTTHFSEYVSMQWENCVGMPSQEILLME